MSLLQWFATFNQNAIGCSDTSADHDSSGRGKAQCTRTCDAQDSGRKLERMLKHRL